MQRGVTVKKTILLVLTVLAAFCLTTKSHASARVDALGTDIREVEDLDLIWLYPNKVIQYKNTVDFRLNAGGDNGTPAHYNNSYPNNGAFGLGTGEWGGVIAEESSLGGVVGVYVNRPSYLYQPSANTIQDFWNISNGYEGTLNPLRYYFGGPGSNSYNTANYYYDVQNIFDLFWAQSLGGADLGVHINYGDNGVGGSPNPPEQAVAGLALGLGFTGVGPFQELNLHADYDIESITDLNNNTNKNKDNGIYSIKLGALGQADLSADNYMRVFADASIDQFDITDLEQYKNNDTTLVLGTSCNHKVNGGKGLVLTGINFAWQQATLKDPHDGIPSDTAAQWDLVWNGSVESELADWLTARFGISAPIVSRSYVGTNSPTYLTNTNNSVNFTGGFGINWQNFTLDGVIDVSELERSINNVAPGNGLFFTGNPIVYVTEADLRYKF